MTVTGKNDGFSPRWAAGLAVGAVPAASLLGGRANPSPDHPRTERWYDRLRKPGFTPPAPVFALAWPAIQAAQAYSGYKLLRAPASPERSAALGFLGHESGRRRGLERGVLRAKSDRLGDHRVCVERWKRYRLRDGRAAREYACGGSWTAAGAVGRLCDAAGRESLAPERRIASMITHLRTLSTVRPLPRTGFSFSWRFSARTTREQPGDLQVRCR